MSSTGGAVGISSTSNELTDSTIHCIEKDSSLGSDDPIIHIEKGELVRVESAKEDVLLLSHEEQFPVDPNEQPETQFTIRAVIVGCLLGGVIAASKSVTPNTLNIHSLIFS